MPISILPTPPDFPPSKPPSKPSATSYAHTNGNSNINNISSPSTSSSDSIALLKQQAKSQVLASAKGASALALLRSARNQYLRAGTCENEGDLRGALTAFTMAAGLAQMVFETSEWNGNSSVKKELKDFMEKDSINLSSRMQAVESKLRMMEKKEKEPTTDEPVSSSGGSIADRLKALQDSGLSNISTTKTKRFSKDLQLASPSSPGFHSPSLSSPKTTHDSPNSSSPSAVSTLTGLTAPLTAPSSYSTTSTSTASSSSSANIYSHAFVSPSTLGPPSPGSSPSSSPTIRPALPSSSSVNRSFSTSSEYNVFNSQFPSIDELDELDGIDGSTPFALPSVPTGRSTSSNRSIGSGNSGSMRSGVSLKNRDSASSLKSNQSNSDLKVSTSPSGPGVHPNNTGSSSNGLASPTPHTALRNFIVPVERPSSTPLRGGSVWDSRPGSPTTTVSKVPPTIPSKPSALSSSRSHGNFDDPTLGLSSLSISSPAPSASISSIPQRNTCDPRELHTYLREHKVILLDVRDRAEFDGGHINAGNKGAMGGVVCIEPSVLRRGNVTSDTIEDSLVLAPPSEASTFNNRHKFDLVVLYDRCSTSFASGPPPSSSLGSAVSNDGANSDINTLLRAIWEREFKKTLRRMPMMLVGGYDAWVKEFGEGEVVSSPPVNATTSNGLDVKSANVGSSSSSIPPPLMSPSISSQTRSPFAPGGPLAPNSPSNSNGPSSAQPTGMNGARVRAGTSPSRAGGTPVQAHKTNYSLDQGHSRSPAEFSPSAHPNPSSTPPSARLARATPTQTSAPLSPHFSGSGALGRRPAVISRASSGLASSSSTNLVSPGPMSTLTEGAASPVILNGATPINYPSFSSSTYSIPSASSSSSTIRSPPSSASFSLDGITSPPQASINPSISRRRTGDYVDQSLEALSGMTGATSPNGMTSGYNGVVNGYSGINGYSAGYGTSINGFSQTSTRKSIDYPELSSSSYHSPNPILRPPPAAAAVGVTRMLTPASTGTVKLAPTSSAASSIPSYPIPGPLTTSLHPTSALSTKLGLPALESVPRIPNSDWPPRYWADSPIGTSGLKNMGNTCYMSAPIQCLSATVPFARYFMEIDIKKVINYLNKMNSQGQLTTAFSRLLHDMWHGDMPYLTPTDFRRTLCSLNKQYIGTDQHDSQEFLSFLLDGIHEDTNRIMARKPVTRTAQEEEKLESLPQQLASEYEWQVWKQSNDSIIVDFFQGQFRNQLRCMNCQKTSTTYNPFSILSLPVPARTGKIPLQHCVKAFFNVEVMEGDDAWDCPRCKTKRRATKTLSLARLPPVLVIHFKRFEANGRFSDKIDTFVDFPVKSLDLTDLMPPPLPAGADHSLLNGGGSMNGDDPRIQVGPYKYDLYGVTNHYGNLSSGHYTAFVASRGGWLYCDDSSVKNVDVKQVVNQKAYVLFYKRVKA